MNEACINEAIEDTTDGIYVLKQHASDEPEDVGGVVLKGIKGLVHPKMKIVINYSPSCRSKPARPSFIFKKQIKIFLISSIR